VILLVVVVLVQRWFESYFVSGRRISSGCRGHLRFVSVTFGCHRLDRFWSVIEVEEEFVLHEASVAVVFQSNAGH
jgi:hypothetical protein